MATSDDREEWRSVVGWEGLYSVSSLGKVRSEPGRHRPGRVLRPLPARGYEAVALSRDGTATRRTIHSVVAAAFLGTRPDGYWIHHRNGIKTDNRAANLEYTTPRQNLMLFLGKEDEVQTPEPDPIRADNALLGSETELWRPVVGFEGWYEVSTWGRVRRDAAHRDWRSRR